MSSVLMFMFGGRRANVELQLPFIRRILDEHPNVHYHLWDLARTPEDSAYLRTIEGDRITVMTDFAGDNPWERFTDVYEFYARDIWQDWLFVKMDDDIVFIETDGFGRFIESVDADRDTVISAKVINNGASSLVDDRLKRLIKVANVRPLDVHKSREYVTLTHGHFFDHWADLVDEEPDLISTRDWLSINLIGYDWAMGKRLYRLLGTPPPRIIAGRPFQPARHRVGDEGAVNMLPRAILQGFTAAHLFFGPQEKKIAPVTADQWRDRYAEIGQKYLEGT